MKKCLFYCDTPFQVFTAINVVQEFYLDSGCDLVLYHQFHNSHRLKECIEKCHVFSHIYDAFPATSKISDIERLIFSKRYIKREIGIKDLHYDEIFFSMLDTNTSLSLYSGLQYSNAVLFDDGAFSYYGGTIHDYINWKRYGLLKISHPHKHFFNFKKIFQYLPELSGNVPYKKIKLVFNFSNLFDLVFDYKENDIYKKPIVYFDHSYKSERKDYYDQIIIEKLEGISSSLVTRIHPRIKESPFMQFNCDKGQNMWEVECAHQITNQHILISVYSTALFTPTMLYNKTPHLIFLYKLCKEMYDEVTYNRIDDHVMRFKKMYHSVPVSVLSEWNELYDLLKIVHKN